MVVGTCSNLDSCTCWFGYLIDFRSLLRVVQTMKAVGNIEVDYLYYDRGNSTLQIEGSKLFRMLHDKLNVHSFSIQLVGDYNSFKKFRVGQLVRVTIEVEEEL